MDKTDISYNETTYTHGHSDAVLRSHRWRTAENSAAYLLAHLAPSMSVLDVGCGPGTLTIDLARLVAPGPVVGIDVSDDVVRQAASLLHGLIEHGLEGVRFEVANLYDMARPKEGFDVVHAHQVLQHLADPVGALQTMGRLISESGIVAARDADYSAMTWWPTDPYLDRWLEIYRAVTQRNRAECDAGRRLLSWAQTAGFAEVQYSWSNWTFCTGADLHWWCDLWADRITSSRLAEQAVAYGVSTANELEDVGSRWRSWAVEPGAVFVVPHGEILARNFTVR